MNISKLDTLIRKAAPSTWNKDWSPVEDPNIKLFTENVIFECMRCILSNDSLHPLKAIKENFGVDYTNVRQKR